MSYAASAVASYDNAKVVNRFDLTKRLVARLKHEEAVIGGIGNTNFDLWSAGHRPQNFYMLGSMGLAIPIAFGVALAQPKRHVIALEGDGSLLMQLGCLATIAAQKPAHPGGRNRRLCGARPRGGLKQMRLGRRRGGFRQADRCCTRRGWPELHRGPHRRQAGRRHHRPRPGSDPRALHDGAWSAEEGVRYKESQLILAARDDGRISSFVFLHQAFSETDMTERAVLGIHRIKSVSGSIKCIWS